VNFPAVAETTRRRLAAIMFTDMVGFTARTQENEARALRMLDTHNQLLRPIFPRYHGTEVKSIGDSFLVEFESTLEAVTCAVEIQRALREYAPTTEEPWRIRVRIGIHLGDVVRSGTDVLGDAVNLASRIEPLADPDGVCVTEPVFEQVRNKIDADFERIPLPQLKNVRSALNVYRLVPRSDPRGSPATGDGAPARHRLAVLPFSNMSPDPVDEFFADGLTEELITELARVPGCQVIARTSVMRYKKEPKAIRDVGRELGVDVALEGSVRKSGARVRITAQLVDAKSEAHLWADRFDREFGEIFALQSEIATRVAGALKVELEPQVRTALGKHATQNLAAYESYLKGRQCWWQSGETNYRTAIRYFEKAIELDPTFALAYCGLADSHALLGNHGHVPLAEALGRAEAAARKALELDSDLADGHVSLAPVLYNRYDWAGAERELRQAIRLEPNHVLGHYWLGVATAVQGKLDEALDEMEKAAGLDPLSRPAVLAPATVLYLKRRFEDALTYLDDLERRTGFRADYTRGMVELALGRSEAALEHVRKGLAGPLETDPIRRAGLTIVLARAGRTEESEAGRRQLEEDARAGKVPAGALALVYAGLGEKDRAFEWFDKAYEERTALVVEDLQVDPLLDGLRSDARYAALRKRFHFAD
jgi:adenylate cyclase